jgi:hypothetical protein
MRTHVTFQTRLFDAEVTDERCAPYEFGEDCARWLAERMAREGLSHVMTEPVQEDWGWEFRVRAERHTFWVGVGPYWDPNEPDTWLAFIDAPLPRFLRWFGRSDDEELQRVCAALDNVLKSSQNIGAVRWYTREQWTKGEVDDGAKSPDSA